MTLSYLRKRLSEVIWHSDMLTTRVSLAVGSLIWAALLLWPTTLFTPARTTYRLMAEVANENVWGVLFLLHGLVALYQLLARELKENCVLAANTVGCVLLTSSTIDCF